MVFSSRGGSNPGRVGGLNSITIYTGRPYPEVQPLHLLYIPFVTEGSPFRIPLIEKLYPFGIQNTVEPPLSGHLFSLTRRQF